MTESLSTMHHQSTDTAQSQHQKPPIFVIGGGRSGTTLMRHMLNAHPNIYILEETSFYSWTQSARTDDVQKKIERFFQSFSFAWLKIPTSQVAPRQGKTLDESDLKATFKRTMEFKASQYGRKRYGDKNPLNIMFLEKLIEDFPGAKIIYVARDPRAQVYSHLTMPFSTPSLLLANFAVKRTSTKVERFKESMLSVKLEDLIRDPKSVMTAVLDYVDEPWDDRVLAHADYPLEDDGIPFPWLSEAGKNRKAKALKWTAQLTPAWIRITERWQRHSMERFNYESHALGHEPSRTAQRIAMLSDIPTLFRSIAHAIKITRQIRRTDKTETEKVQRLVHSFNPWAWDLHPEWDSRLPRPPEVRR